MIEIIEIVGDKYDIDDTTRKYVTKKINHLDRYLPSHARKSASTVIRLKEVNRANGNKYEAEIVLNVPDKQLTAIDSTSNMLAAIDIVEAKLLNQLKKYKEDSILHIGNRRAMSKFKNSFAREQES